MSTALEYFHIKFKQITQEHSDTMYWSMILGVLRFDISYIVRKILGNDIYKINQNYINKTISHFITQQIIPIIKKHNNISIFY